MSKRPALLIIAILVISSIMMVESAFAQSITKPSVPEFTVKLVAHPYDVPPTTTTAIDQYTGKEIVTTTPGYHVENKSIEITVTNQPFTPYTDAEGNPINLYYNFRFRGHFGEESDWQQPYNKTIRNGIYGTTRQIPQSSSEYTLISFPSEFQDGDVVDFQVQTLEGFYTPWEPILVVHMGTSQFTGEASDWSSTQTLEIGEIQISSPSPAATPTPTLSPTISPSPLATPYEIPIIGMAFTVIILAAGIGLLIYLIKRK